MLSGPVALTACFFLAGCASAMPGPSITTTASGVIEHIPVTRSKPGTSRPFDQGVVPTGFGKVARVHEPPTSAVAYSAFRVAFPAWS